MSPIRLKYLPIQLECRVHLAKMQMLHHKQKLSLNLTSHIPGVSILRLQEKKLLLILFGFPLAQLCGVRNYSLERQQLNKFSPAII